MLQCLCTVDPFIMIHQEHLTQQIQSLRSYERLVCRCDEFCPWFFRSHFLFDDFNNFSIWLNLVLFDVLFHLLCPHEVQNYSHLVGIAIASKNDRLLENLA